MKRLIHPHVLYTIPNVVVHRSLYLTAHQRAVIGMHAVAAASLPRPDTALRDGPGKQETPGIAVPEVSTAPDLSRADEEGRCAQCDTEGT